MVCDDYIGRGRALRIAVGITLLILLLSVGGVVQAAAVLPEIPQEPQMPGRLEANGTHFELNNSEYLNITLDSSEPINLTLESVPEMVTMHIESASGANSAQIILGGFLSHTTYHKYEDDYHNHTIFTTDANGKYTYIQDLSKKHFVFIQPRPSTKFINNNATGGDCISIGAWTAATKTCTLSTDFGETIQIDSDGITLNGNGHTITGSSTGNGVYLSSRTDVIIKNLNVRRFNTGIYLYYSSNNNTLSGNNASNNYEGIYLRGSSNNTLSGNNASMNNNNGIYLLSFGNNTLSGNNASNNLYGIYLYSSSNTLTGNNASNNNIGIFLDHSSNNTLGGNNANSNNYDGIYLYSSSNNMLGGNNASSNSYTGIYLYSSSNNNTLSGNNASNNNYGIDLGFSSKSLLKNNIMKENNMNFGSGGSIDSEIDTSNLVDGKPIYYIKGAADIVYDSYTNAGTFYCINCVNVTLKNLDLKNNYHGIFFLNTTRSKIQNVTASNNYYGIDLDSSSNNTLSGNNASNNNYGIDLSFSSKSLLKNNIMKENNMNFRSGGSIDSEIDTSNLVDGKPIYYIKGAADIVYDSSTNAGTFYCISCVNVTLKNLDLKNNYHGIFFLNTTRSKIQNVNASNNYYGIYLLSSSNNNLVGNNASSNNYNGIHLESSSNNNMVSSNNAWNNFRGISLEYSSNNNTLSGNNASSNNYDGIYLYSSSNNTLSGNNANSNNNYNGIYLVSSSNNTLRGNNASSNNRNGIYLETSNNNNALSGNNASLNNYNGIYLSSSSNNTLIDNNANSNVYLGPSNGNGVGIILSSSNNNTLSGNTANSNSGYSMGLDLGFGIGILVSSSNNNTLNGNTANSNFGSCLFIPEYGVFKTYSCYSDGYGIFLSSSNNNNLSGNTANSNSGEHSGDEQGHGYGIFLSSSNNNTLSGNNASSNSGEYYNSYGYGCGYGISLIYSSNNTLSGNNGSSNSAGDSYGYSCGYGISLFSSSNNLIYNNIFNNTNNVEISDSNNNNWNITKQPGTNIVGGTYLGGNYWADPDGTGFSQKCMDPNGDGICDTIYALDSQNIDYLPLAVNVFPIVIGNTPVGTEIPVTTEITLTFSKSMNQSSVQSAFSTSPATTGSFSWDANNMTYTPDSNLAYSTTYTVTVGTGAMDLAGNNLQSPHSWQFTASVIGANYLSVNITPASQTINAGKNLTIKVFVNPENFGISAGQIDLKFNASVFQVTSLIKGDILGTDAFDAGSGYDNTAGTVSAVLARVGATIPPTNPGTWTTINLTSNKTARAGTYSVNITYVGIADETFTDIENIKINNGSIKLVALVGDINGDCKVDYKDLGILGAAYGKVRGVPGYREDADLNGDGKIDYKDLGMLGSNYGKTC